MLWGIAIAVILAILLFFRRSWWPHGSVLGRVDGLPGWHSIDTYPAAGQLPGIVVYRWEAPLFFANAGRFRDQVRHLARTEQVSWVVLQCEAITDIDVTAADMLEQLDDELNAQGIHLAFAELRSRLQDRVWRYGLFETLDSDHFYPDPQGSRQGSRGHRASAAGRRDVRRARAQAQSRDGRRRRPPPGGRPASLLRPDEADRAPPWYSDLRRRTPGRDHIFDVTRAPGRLG